MAQLLPCALWRSDLPDAIKLFGVVVGIVWGSDQFFIGIAEGDVSARHLLWPEGQGRFEPRKLLEAVRVEPYRQLVRL